MATEPTEPQGAPTWYAEVTAAAEPAPPAEAVHAEPPESIEEPSGLVDFDEVKQELIAIGVEWLGDPGADQVTDLIRHTRPTIDDFVALIDTVRGLRIQGFEASAVQSMAKAMHRHAAERLCGA